MITLYQDAVIYEIGRDVYGKPIKKNEQLVKCRAKEKYQLVKNNAAIETVSQLEFTFYPDTKINLDDKIEYEGEEYSIISYSITRDPIGEAVKKKVFV